MSNYERDDTVTEDVREGADDLGDAAKRGADEVEEGAKSLTDKVDRRCRRRKSRVIATTTVTDRYCQP